MPYCRNCGSKLHDGSKFCAECGAPIQSDDHVDNSKRSILYDGELHKCPSCGENINSYVTSCPSCGYELRSIQSMSAVKEFAQKLENIEAKREYEKPHKLSLFATSRQHISKTDEQKISLIRSFSIPNTKEDMLDFMILATSCINYDLYDSFISKNVSRGPKEINSAWFSKVQQVYEKAKMNNFSDDTFSQIEKLYLKCKDNIRRAKKRGIIKWILMFGWIPIFAVIVFLTLYISKVNVETKEIARLDGLVIEVQEALETGEYKHALRLADSIEYREYDDTLESEWAVRREYWIDNVIAEAAKNGIELVHPDASEHQETDRVPSAENTEIPPAFTAGYEKAAFDNYNSLASGNDLANSRIYIVCTLDKTEILEADGTTSILGYVTDDTNNEWLIQLHFFPAVSRTAFDSYIGKELVLRGVYSGYSGVKKMPVIVLDEMIVIDTGENVMGMQKLLDE